MMDLVALLLGVLVGVGVAAAAGFQTRSEIDREASRMRTARNGWLRRLAETSSWKASLEAAVGSAEMVELQHGANVAPLNPHQGMRAPGWRHPRDIGERIFLARLANRREQKQWEELTSDCEWFKREIAALDKAIKEYEDRPLRAAWAAWKAGAP